jgi:nucleoid DNA-binding protein
MAIAREKDLYKELVDNEFCTSKARAKELVKFFKDYVEGHPLKGNTINFINFGTFVPYKRQNGKFKVSFKTSSVLKRAVDETLNK